MRKNTGETKQVAETKLVCDCCETDLKSDEYIRYDAHYSDGYDTFGDDADFCSLDCMSKFLEEHSMYSIYFPPDNEDVRLEIPTGMFKIILSKLGD